MPAEAADAVLGNRDGGPARVRRELGVVLHADTLLDDGPAADEPGQVRGAGAPVADGAGYLVRLHPGRHARALADLSAHPPGYGQ